MIIRSMSLERTCNGLMGTNSGWNSFTWNGRAGSASPRSSEPSKVLRMTHRHSTVTMRHPRLCIERRRTQRSRSDTSPSVLNLGHFGLALFAEEAQECRSHFLGVRPGDAVRASPHDHQLSPFDECGSPPA